MCSFQRPGTARVDQRSEWSKMGQSLIKSFERNSSPVDWCEPNYVESSVIAEYWNTMSNVLFIALPVAILCLFRPYCRMFGPSVQVILPLIIVVGLSSIYFHSTLSFAGQMLDELSIFWSLCAACAAFLPNKYVSFFGGNRKLLSSVCAVSCFVLTGVLLVNPYLNSFILMLAVVPFILIVYRDTKRNKRLHRLSVRAVVTCIVAVTIWILDRMFCNVWLYVGFPYLHAVWHIFIAIPTCVAFVVGTYIKIRDEMPGYHPELKFWPANDVEVGVPYITVVPGTYLNLVTLVRHVTDVLCKSGFQANPGHS